MRIFSIITSGLGGTHLITQGYGYSIIVVPVVRGGVIRPEVIYVTRKYKFPVFQLDVLSELDSVEIRLPTGVFVTKPGWPKIDPGIRKASFLPREAQGYMETIVENLKVPVSMVSIGAERSELILKG